MDLDSDLNGSNKIDTAIPRQLVLDYLLHNCYGETARAFMKDDLDSSRDSESRKNGSIQNVNGNSSINGASTLNSSNGISSNHIQGGVMTRNAPDDPQSMDTDKEYELDQEGDSPMGESYLGMKNGNLSAGTLTADKAQALQFDEQLKNLETRKAIRNLISNGDIGPAMDLCNSAFPGVLSIDRNSPLTTQESIRMNFKLQCQKFIEIIKADPEHGHHALMFAQQILHDFKQLDPEGKEMYEKKMVDIIGIIAYPNPEESPQARQLKQEARDDLADIMNSAVLGYNGMSPEPALLRIVKQTTLVRECLAAEPSKSKRSGKAPQKWRLATFLDESS